LDRRFTYYYLISPLGRAQLLRFDNGTDQPNLSSASVKKYLVPTPPLAEQRRIAAKVEELLAVCECLESKLEACRTARTALLESTLPDALRQQRAPMIAAAVACQD
jgi:type I restriction enzyme S subunit